MQYKEVTESTVVPAPTKAGWYHYLKHHIAVWIANRSKTQQSIGMIASANIAGTVVGLVGSLVQARFITPDVLGFIRKYSVVSSYAIFFSLGLFIILQREYAVLIGRGEKEKAYRTVSIVQSWCLLVAVIACGILMVLTIIGLFNGHWREASAWFIQVVGVWVAIYGGFLDSTYRSGQEFERKAKGNFFGSIGNAATIPVFWLWSFPALILRSVVGSIISSIYLYLHRPVKVGWCFPKKEFLALVKRGLRLFASDYLRYNFWLTVEIWLVLYFAGDKGVGLYVFSTMMVEMSFHICTAINLVYIPQLAQKFGQTGKITSCIKLATKPTFLNLGISIFIILGFWFILPPIISYAFPNYLGSIPIFKILAFRILLVSISLPMYILIILESYITQFIAVVTGLLAFVGTAFTLNSLGFTEIAVPWGTLVGQAVFAGICLTWLGLKIYSRQSKTSVS